MKILIYNWIHLDDIERRGGGVSVYVKNTVTGLLAAGHDVTFLHSGTDYSPLSRRPHVRKSPTSFGDRVKSFSLWNSEVTAPAHASFGTSRLFDRGATFDQFSRFLREQGKFDVVHFNNLEGLPASVLALRPAFPDTKFIYSLHNYFSVCPQVNLWKDEAENCLDYREGHDCITCVPQPPTAEIRIAYSLSGALQAMKIRPGSRPFALAYSFLKAARPFVSRVAAIRRRLVAQPALERNEGTAAEHQNSLRKNAEHSAEKFRQRRKQFTDLMNTYCDTLISVSDRTADVHAKFGLDRSKISVSYIGTKHAVKDRVGGRRLEPAQRGHLHIAYLGYMRRDKGFFFLLDALEALPTEIASRIKLTVAAKSVGRETFERLEDLAFTLDDVVYYDGYSQADIDKILSQEVDLGIVPVQWEDCLPQVAIEIAAKGIPVLTSDLGGAMEIGRNKLFTFDAGSIITFHKRLEQVLSGEVALSSFWPTMMELRTVDEATLELLSFYEGKQPAATDLYVGGSMQSHDESAYRGAHVRQ